MHITNVRGNFWAERHHNSLEVNKVVVKFVVFFKNYSFARAVAANSADWLKERYHGINL
jgi:hypothetical protein